MCIIYYNNENLMYISKWLLSSFIIVIASIASIASNSIINS